MPIPRAEVAALDAAARNGFDGSTGAARRWGFVPPEGRPLQHSELQLGHGALTLRLVAPRNGAEEARKRGRRWGRKGTELAGGKEAAPETTGSCATGPLGGTVSIMVH